MAASKAGPKINPGLKSRRVAQGDTPPRLTPGAIAHYVPERTVRAARGKQQAMVENMLHEPSGLSAEERLNHLKALLDEASPDDVAAMREAFLSIPELAERSEALNAARARLERDLAEVRSRPQMTRTLLRLRDRAPSPPFVVILRDCYHPHNDFSCLRGEDALTFNGLLRAHPGLPLRLLHVAVHLYGGSGDCGPEEWEAVPATCAGWVHAECEDGGDAAAAEALTRGLVCIYGGGEPPGAVDNTQTSWAGIDIENAYWSVVRVG